jgi:hypothetical protein
MTLRRFVRSIMGITILAMGLAAPLYAGFIDHRTMAVTFGTPVELPGVALARGTYIFELASPDTDPTIVRVLSRDRSTVYLPAFTQLVRRPADRRARTVSLGEAASGRAAPVIAWYPEGDSNGRRFIYPEGRDSVAGLAD